MKKIIPSYLQQKQEDVLARKVKIDTKRFGEAYVFCPVCKTRIIITVVNIFEDKWQYIHCSCKKISVVEKI